MDPREPVTPPDEPAATATEEPAAESEALDAPIGEDLESTDATEAAEGLTEATEPVPEPTSAPEAVPETTTELEPEPEPAPVPVSTGPRTVGRLVADALRTAGVRYAFTVPGESFLGLLDALGEAGIRVVATRHEGGAAFMAEAHGNLTGRPAACLGTRAVGGANLAIGIHTARADSSPMFAIVGQVERAHRGHEAFQEIDQVATIGGLAKWAVEPGSAEEVSPAMTEALRQAQTGRPGPVLLSFPEDLLDELAPEEARVEASRAAAGRPTAHPGRWRRAPRA